MMSKKEDIIFAIKSTYPSDYAKDLIIELYKRWQYQYGDNDYFNSFRDNDWHVPTTSMKLGNDQVVEIGSRIVEEKYGPGEVVSFYGYDCTYIVDVLHDDGNRRSYHPSLFPGQIRLEE